MTWSWKQPLPAFIENLYREALQQGSARHRPVHRGTRSARRTEEGSLTFKKSLFAGVLDGGEREVFLGGSRLSRFMETVEKTTTAIGESADIGREGVREAKREPRIAVASTVPAAGSVSGWAAV